MEGWALLICYCHYSPVPSSSPEEQGHIVIQGLVDKMAAGVTTLSQLWTKRNDQLELCKKVIEFEQQVPEVCMLYHTTPSLPSHHH